MTPDLMAAGAARLQRGATLPKMSESGDRSASFSRLVVPGEVAASCISKT
jgi:hypothetical protein